jgi:hypothetical protein
MPITINNYNFTSVIYQIGEFTPVYIEFPTAVITIVPNAGYTATVSDFSLDPSFSDPAVQTVVFAQSGLNVTCTITFQTSFVMPANNYTIPLCIIGEAKVSLITISGTFTATIGANITPVSETSTVYSDSGSFGETDALFSRTYTAAAGYYLKNPSANIVTGNQANYTVSQTPTYDSEGNLIVYSLNCSYTYPINNVSGDFIDIKVPSEAIFVPAQEIISYTFDTSPVSLGGSQRVLTLFGDEGAVFTILITDTLGNSYNAELNATMDATGTFSTIIVFPDVTGAITNIVYTITLSGDLASSFSQVNPIILTQYAINPIISIGGSSSFGITGFTTFTRQGPAFMSPTNTFMTATWPLSVSSPSTISYDGDIEMTDFLYTQPLGADTEVVNSVSNSSTVTLIDATGILVNDQFNLFQGNSQLAPFQHKVTGVAGNVLTVSPNITAAAGTILQVYRTKGNVIDNATITATQVDPQNVTIDLSVQVIEFGEENVTFTLDLDNVIDKVGGQVFGPYSFNFNTTNATDACCGPVAAVVYLDSNSLSTATNIYANSSGSALASAGFYSTNGTYRYWDGSSFPSTAINTCPSCSTSLSLCYSSTSANDLCCNTSTNVTVYVGSGQTFLNNTGLYSDSSLTTAAPNGYYSQNANTCFNNLP